MINFIKNIFKGKKEKPLPELHKGSLEYALSLNLKHTVTLGLLSSEFIDNGKDNYQILSINFTTDRGSGLIEIIIQQGLKVDRIEMSPQEAVMSGFINPYGLNKYCTL